MNISELRRIVEKILKENTALKERSMYVYQDIFEHIILRELYSTELFREKVAFKGGTALSKCYLNYHRFSVDLDFTYLHGEEARELSRTKKNMLNRETREKIIVPVLRDVERRLKPLGISLQYPVSERGFMMGTDVFSAVYIINNEIYSGEIRIEFNLGEELHYPARRIQAKTIFGLEIGDYRPVEVLVYDSREILAEKYKAMLTRIVWRDYFDAYFLWKMHGDMPENLREIIIEKGVRNMRRKMLRRRFYWVREKIGNDALTRILDQIRGERFMILSVPDTEEFEKFVNSVMMQIAPMMDDVEREYVVRHTRELVEKYTVPTPAGYRIRARLLEKNKEDYSFYLEHKDEFERIADKMYAIDREMDDEIEM